MQGKFFMKKTVLVLILLVSVLIPARILSGESVKALEPELNDIGLGIGHAPPSFTLPDLYTGELISLSDFRGKKTVFFMWASW
jgi:hypothetical protein